MKQMIKTSLDGKYKYNIFIFFLHYRWTNQSFHQWGIVDKHQKLIECTNIECTKNRIDNSILIDRMIDFNW